MSDKYEEMARELLPCDGLTITLEIEDFCSRDESEHSSYCAAYHQPAVAAALRAVDTQARAEGYAEGVEAAALWLDEHCWVDTPDLVTPIRALKPDATARKGMNG